MTADTEFTVGSNNYTFEGIYVSSTGGTTGALNFKTVALLSDDDKSVLELHIDVDGTSSTRAISDAVAGVATGLILWTSAGLDWSLATTVTARLRTPSSDDPVDDCPHDTTTTCEVDVGGSVMGTLDANGDEDWFKVDLETGKLYQLDLEGAYTSRGTLPDPFLSLYDGSGTIIVTDDDGGASVNSRLVYTATATGAYYLGAKSASGPVVTGTYTLSVRDITPADDSDTEEDDLPAGTTTTGTVEVDGSAVRGDIYEPVAVTHTVTDDEGNETEHIRYDFDTDWFAVELAADRTYRIDMRGAMLSTDTDLTLRLPQINAIYDSGRGLPCQHVWPRRIRLPLPVPGDVSRPCRWHLLHRGERRVVRVGHLRADSQRHHGG